MRSATAALVLAIATACAVAAAGEGGEGGFIKGKLSPPERAAGVVKVIALDRKVKQKLTAKTVKMKEFPAKYNAATGEFEAGPLPAGTYDLYLELGGGKLEGADMRAWDERDLSKKLTGKDRAAIIKMVARMKTWANERRVFTIDGNGKCATALVELLRTDKTSFDKKAKEPFVVWRVELWYYRKLYGTWRREDDAKVLRRFMIGLDDWKKWTWTFEPALGGIDVKAGETRRFEFDLPDGFRVGMGRVGGKSKPADGTTGGAR